MKTTAEILHKQNDVNRDVVNMSINAFFFFIQPFHCDVEKVDL